MRASGNTEEIVLEASITRADGTVEPQGVVAYWHRRWYKRLAYRLCGGKGKAKPCA